MASKKLEKTILNLFEPNITESISAEDLQIFTAAIFQASESVIHKFDNKNDVDSFRNSNPDIPIYKNDIVILTNLSTEAGIYSAKADLPFFKDLEIIADLSTDLDISINDLQDGDILVYNSTYQQWINKSLSDTQSNERPLNPQNGMMFFDSTIGLPIWFNGRSYKWVDATGKNV